jgi:2,4-diketo-3-deoxy-L-fuconate hydrolase
MSTGWRLLSYSPSGSDDRRPGLLTDGRVLDLGLGTQFNAPSTMEILESWDDLRPRLDKLATTFDDVSLSVEDVVLRAPVARPCAVFCANSNYGDHVAEMSGRPLIDKTTTTGPYMFLKAPHAVADPYADVTPPPESEQLDWEVELGVVIGRPGRRISVENAYDHVAGYVVLNEYSLRDMARPEVIQPFGMDELSSKSFDGGLPMGPWLTPRDAVGDPMNLHLELAVGDEVMQDSNTRFMHFDIREQIAFLSLGLTMRPGDVIATGTPSGVGRPRGRFLQDGEVVTAEIEGLGSIRNRIVRK